MSLVFNAYDLLPEAYLIVDESYCVRFANKQYLDITGQVAQAIFGLSVYDINQQGNLAARQARRDLLDGMFGGLRSAKSVDAGLLQYPKADGDASDVRWWRTRATCARDDTDCESVTFFIICLTDVTLDVTRLEHVQREKARLRSQAQLRKRMVEDAQRRIEEEAATLKSALEFAKIGAWTIDLATMDIVCTAQCKANFGLPDTFDVTVDKLLNELIAPIDRERVRNTLTTALETGSTYETEYRTISPNGDLHWIMARGNLAFTDQKTGFVSGFTLDITARKVLDLANEAKLEQETAARKASDERVATIDTFVSSVSHELRSPLNAISSWVGLLRYPERAPLARVEEVIKRNVAQLARLVEDLLDTGAILNGKLAVSLEPLDLAVLVSRVVEDVRPAIESKDIQLLDLCHGSFAVRGDAARLQQVVFNLLTNASKFTRAGSIVVALGQTGNEVTLSVADTGQGIAPDRQAAIFERFNRGSVSGGDGIHGLGLGLWLVKSIVEAHAGAINVSSAGVGRGATFVVTLPLTKYLQ